MQLYDSGELRKACLSIGGSDWADDLLQEILLVLFEKPEAKIVEAYNAGYLRFYVVRIIMNFWGSKNSGFYMKYRHLDDTVSLDANEYRYQRAENGSSNIVPAGDTWEYNARGIDIKFDNSDIENRIDHDRKLCALESAIERMAQGKDFPYEQKLLQLHLQLKTKKKVSRATGIPYRTVCHNLDEIYKRLKDELTNH